MEIRFRKLLIESDLQQEVLVLDRLLELRSGHEPTSSPQDRHLTHLIMMFDFLNRCGMTGGTTPDEAHDPINRNTELRRRYAERRASGA